MKHQQVGGKRSSEVHSSIWTPVPFLGSHCVHDAYLTFGPRATRRKVYLLFIWRIACWFEQTLHVEISWKKMLGHQINVQIEKDWSYLWKMQVPPKIRVFLWRLAQHSLPTYDVLEDHNMSDTPNRLLCGCEDSWRHSLRSDRCPVVYGLSHKKK